MNRLAALALVDEALAAHAAWIKLEADGASAATMALATRERDAARFKVVAAIAPEPMPLRLMHEPEPPG